MSERRVAPIMLATALITMPATALLTLWWTGRSSLDGAGTTVWAPTPPVSQELHAPPIGDAGPLPGAVPPTASSDVPLARPIPPSALDRQALPWAAGFEHLAATDLDGDGTAEVALAGPGLQVYSLGGRRLGQAPAAGGVDVLDAFDGAVYVGWGRDKQAPNAAASVVRYRLGRRGLSSEIITSPTSTRPQIVSIGPAGSDLLLAWFTDKYDVTARRASAAGGAWTLSPLVDTRTAPVWLTVDLDGDGTLDLVYGRTYGDEVGSKGDAWFVAGGGGSEHGTSERVAIPTTGGVRAGCTADTDGDGRPEVVLADGWDKDYGRRAVAQVRLVTWESGAPRSVVLDRSVGDYDIRRLVAADLNGDGRDEILAVTNRSLRVIARDAEGWVAWSTAPGAADVAVARDPRGAHVIVVGTTPEAFTLK